MCVKSEQFKCFLFSLTKKNIKKKNYARGDNYRANVFSSNSGRFIRRQQTKHLRVTRSFSRAINYTREANLSESIIIAAARQNYVLTSRKPRCLRRSTPWLITATRSFYHFFRSSRSIIPCNVIYEASGFDEAGETPMKRRWLRLFSITLG